MKKKCLVLGGAGFIGSHIADRLLSLGIDVRILDKINCYKGNIEHLRKDIDFLEGDFLNSADIENALQGMDFAIHLAWTTLPNNSNANPAYDIESNMIGSIRLFDACINAGVEKVVFISSGGAIYGRQDKFPIKEDAPTNPLCSYGITKLAIEKYLELYQQLHNLKYSVIRLANPYGPRQNPISQQGIIPVFLNKIKTGEKIIVWGNGDVVRDFIFIDDAVSAITASMLVGKSNITFNVGSGNGISINDLLNILREVTKMDFQVEYTHLNRKADVPANYLDSSLISKELGWRPTVSIEEGIERTWEWVKSL